MALASVGVQIAKTLYMSSWLLLFVCVALYFYFVCGYLSLSLFCGDMLISNVNLWDFGLIFEMQIWL